MTATTTSNVGAYGITQGDLIATSNYALSYIGANLSVTAAPLTANAQSRLYGAANPALTYVSSAPKLPPIRPRRQIGKNWRLSGT